MQGGLALAAVHEVFSEGRQSAAATGFVVGLAGRATARRPLLWIQQEFAGIESGALSMSGFSELGLDPRRVVTVRAADVDAALRTAADALACDALGAVVLEVWGEARQFDLVASRKLTLAAQASSDATSSRTRSPSTRASRCTRSPTARSTSSSSTGAWPLRRRAAPRGVDAGVDRLVEARARVSRPAGRRRRDHALELALHDAERAARAGAGGRQRRRVDARLDHRGLLGEARRVHRRRQLPAGVFNMVTGPGSEVGDEIAGSAGTQAIAFIGSTATGAPRRPRAAGKPQLLELGGNGPLVVLDDADVAAAAGASVSAAFLCAGQSCTAGERFLVHEAVHDEFVERLREEVARIRLGDPFDEATTMGPLNNESTAEKMDRHVADALERGAEAVAGGARADGFPRRSTGRPRCSTASPTRWRSRARRRSARSSRSRRSAPTTRRSRSRTRRRTACSPRSGRATSPAGCASPRPSAPGG